jgi:hypothetical protein
MRLKTRLQRVQPVGRPRPPSPGTSPPGWELLGRRPQPPVPLRLEELARGLAKDTVILDEHDDPF